MAVEVVVSRGLLHLHYRHCGDHQKAEEEDYCMRTAMESVASEDESVATPPLKGKGGESA